MNVVELIARKRDGHKLSGPEIRFIMQGYVDGSIPDYQMSAFIMAYYFQDMLAGNLYYDELALMTQAMVESGDTLDFSSDHKMLYDKHSTGGVGDKISFLSAPIVAACGLPALLLSGRGLGHTGGTLDKMESVPGVKVDFNQAQLSALLQKTGLVIAGTTGSIAPADKKLYALRDVTATVPSVGLISASILSKKLAISPSCLVLDVKYGSGAFMKKLEDARRLATTMKRTLNELERPCRVLLTSMEQPLGRAIGNALEIKESLAILRGQTEGLEDAIEVALALATASIELSGQDPATARQKAEDALQSGAALEKFIAFMAAQGADRRFLETDELLPASRNTAVVRATESGFITAIDSEALGLSANLLGAGRFQLGQAIDHATGIVLSAKLGQKVEEGATLATLHYNDAAGLAQASQRVQAAFQIDESQPRIQPLIQPD